IKATSRNTFPPICLPKYGLRRKPVSADEQRHGRFRKYEFFYCTLLLLLRLQIFRFKIMSYLFTSESVSEGHPDKVSDQISDALIDHFMAFDPTSKVACETLVTTGQVVLAGEVKTNTYLDVQSIARDTIRKIGYTKSEYMFDANSCGIMSAIHDQSADINQGVDRQNPEEQGAGDQGMMFGYATKETENYTPLALDLAH